MNSLGHFSVKDSDTGHSVCVKPTLTIGYFSANHNFDNVIGHVWCTLGALQLYFEANCFFIPNEVYSTKVFGVKLGQL